MTAAAAGSDKSRVEIEYPNDDDDDDDEDGTADDDMGSDESAEDVLGCCTDGRRGRTVVSAKRRCALTSEYGESDSDAGPKCSADIGVSACWFVNDDDDDGWLVLAERFFVVVSPVGRSPRETDIMLGVAIGAAGTLLPATSCCTSDPGTAPAAAALFAAPAVLRGVQDEMIALMTRPCLR